MKHNAGSLVGVVVSLVAVLSFGQEAEQQATTTLFQEYADAMVGVWEGEATLDADVPGVGDKGDKITSYSRIAWAAQRMALEGNWRIGETSGQSISVWDPVAKQIRAYATMSDGATASLTIERDDTNWIWGVTIILADGTKETGTTIVEVSDDGDTHTHVSKDRVRGSDPLPDSRTVWRRVSRTADGLSPGQRRLQVLAFLIGDWETTDANGGVSRVSYEWMNNQSYIMFRSGDYKEITGWDLRARQIVSWCFGTHGGQGRSVWTIHDDNKITIQADPMFYDRYGWPLVSEMTIVRVDDDTLNLSGVFGKDTWEAVSRRVKP
jgi:hypothetical protein